MFYLGWKLGRKSHSDIHLKFSCLDQQPWSSGLQDPPTFLPPVEATPASSFLSITTTTTKMTDATTSPVEEEQNPPSLAVVSTSQAQQCQKMTPALKMPEEILTTEGDELPSVVENCQEETPQGKEPFIGSP